MRKEEHKQPGSPHRTEMDALNNAWGPELDNGCLREIAECHTTGSQGGPWGARW